MGAEDVLRVIEPQDASRMRLRPTFEGYEWAYSYDCEFKDTNIGVHGVEGTGVRGWIWQFMTWRYGS